MASGLTRAAVDVPTVDAAERVQRELRRRVDHAGPGPRAGALRTVVGLDAAYARHVDAGGLVAGAVVVLDAATLRVVDASVAVTTVTFPYVPGLLAFRELPALAQAWEALAPPERPTLLVCDGHGRAHPRRAGLACHVGVLTGLPSVGVAKAPHVGTYAPPGPHRGDASDVVDGGEVVGAALRTQDGVREVFVSVGHGIALDTACRHVLAASPRYRLPETTRAADRLSKEALRRAGATA